MIWTILIFILILGILVFVHEFGHFIAAKKSGVKVEEFGFGLPPRAIGKKIGETIYSINWLPFGGFVRLYGEDEENPEKVMKEKSKAFFAKSTGVRAFIITAGVIMNVFLGWLIYTYLYTQGVSVPTDKVVVEQVAEGSPAESAGLMKGDVIISLTDQGGHMYYPKTPQELIDVTNKNLDKQVTVVVDRDGRETTMFVTPRSKAPSGEGAMGIAISPKFIVKTYPLYQAPYLALKQSLLTLKVTLFGFGQLLYKLVTFQSVRNDVAGPIGIGVIVDEARKFGENAVLELMALLSFNLALLNILPFPALDGGRLLFVLIEAVTKKRVNPKWERNLHQIGMAILLTLIVLITINDILRLAKG
jgi:regulator of sigma E protease